MAETQIEATPQAINVPVKIPIIPEAYYTRAEIEEAGICGWLTLLRAEKAGRLIPSRCGRKVLYRGAAIIAWLSGKKGGK